MVAENWRELWGAKVSEPCDMPLDQLKQTICFAKELLGSLGPGSEPTQEMACKLKEWCDATYGSHWVVILGRHFGTEAVHQSKQFTFFYVGDIACMVTRI